MRLSEHWEVKSTVQTESFHAIVTVMATQRALWKQPPPRFMLLL